jgi:hypothetical protein
MSQSTNRVFQAFAAVNAAIAELQAAQEGISDDEITLDLPSVLLCTYEPLKHQAGFMLVGRTNHITQVLAASMDIPANLAFSSAFTDALAKQLATRGA